MLIGDIIDVFRKGRSVAQPELWKNMGATTAALAGIASSAMAVAAAFGYRIDIDNTAVEAIAGGIAGVLFLIQSGLHIATSEKVGLPAKAADNDERLSASNGRIDEYPDYRG